MRRLQARGVSLIGKEGSEDDSRGPRSRGNGGGLSKIVLSLFFV